MRISRVVILAFAVSLAITSCAGRTEKTAFEQAKAIDARPFLSERELLRSVSEETWTAMGLSGPAGPAGGGEKPINGIVVPHHTAAAALSAELISRLAESRPPTVIILAPNHYNVGAAASGTACDFLCYGKRIPADKAAIERLRDAGLISIDDAPFDREHSVGELMPIIAWYLPDVEVIPVIFHHGYDEQKILDVIEALKPEIDAGAVIMASIDFSHYLPMAQAEEKDREMMAYLENGDADIIAGLDSGYIDSPTIMAAMLLYFGTDSMEIVENTNSGALMQNPVSPCTSYFTIEF